MCPITKGQFFAVVSLGTRVNDVRFSRILARTQKVNEPMRLVPASSHPYDVVTGGGDVFASHLPWGVPTRLAGPLEA